MVKVSIILPVYNAALTLFDAIDSIINQTYNDWELLIINDGSVDRTEEIILSFKDSRIKYIKNDINRGLIYSLNRGLSIANGEYLARMDADDISEPTRIEKQVVFMDSHPNIIICGTQITYFGTKSSDYTKLKFPTNNTKLKDMLAFSTCFAHPTVMIRRSVMEFSGIIYDFNYKNAEDYNLWIDLMDFGEYANLQERLLKYRVSDNQISQLFNLQTEKSVLACKRKYLEQHIPKDDAILLFESPIDISIIKRIKRNTKNLRIIEACYLSLSKYNIVSLLYFIFSLDAFHLGGRAFLRFMKRFIFGKKPVYYKIGEDKKEKVC